MRTTPWITEDALRYIESFFPMQRILEFGAGGSSIWFSHRARTITVEHDEEWIGKVAETDKHWIPILAERPYHHISNLFADNTFDLIMVDGRDRVACVASSMRLLKPGGLFVLDNSERPRYAPALQILNCWNRMDFTQTIPDQYGYIYDGWTTSVWRKS